MPSRRDISAGRAYVRLFLKNDFSKQLSGALKAAGAKMQSFGRGAMVAGGGMMAAGTAMLAPLAGMVSKFAAAGDQLDKMSLRTGVSVEALSELKFAAEQSGTSIEDLEKSIKRMQGTLTDAELGLSTALDGLDMVGLKFEELEGLSPEDQFQKIANGIAAIEDPSKKSAAAQKLFGKSGVMLIPMLDNMRELRKEARDLGITLSTEDAKAAAELTDQMNRLKQTIASLAFEVGRTLAESFIGAGATLTDLGARVRGWISQSRGLVILLAATGAALVAAGTAVVAFGVTLWGAGMAMSALGSAVGLLLSPIGLITAAVVAAGVAFVRWTETGKAAYESLTANFGKLLGWVKEVFAGIRNAMAGGDMQLAAEILWAGIQAAWAKGMGWIRTKWAELRFFLVDMWAKAAFGILDTLNYLWSSMVKGFWKAADGIVDAWKGAEKSLAKGIAYIMAKIEGLDPEQVISNVDEDYDRNARKRKEIRFERDREAEEKANERYLAVEQARQDVMDAEKRRREAATADAEKALASARERLSVAIEKAAALEPVPPGAVDAIPGFGMAAMPKMPVPVAQRPRVALTATYSAAAAQIAGYQAAGPQEKMANGIKTLVVKVAEGMTLLQQFLAGWKVD